MKALFKGKSASPPPDQLEWHLEATYDGLWTSKELHAVERALEELLEKPGPLRPQARLGAGRVEGLVQ